MGIGRTSLNSSKKRHKVLILDGSRMKLAFVVSASAKGLS